MPLARSVAASLTALLRAGVSMRFVTASCKPAWQECRAKSTNFRAASEHGGGCLRIFCEIKLSLQSRASFSDLIFEKCSESETIKFFSIFKCKPSSRCSPVRFLSTTFPDRGPYFGDPRSHIARENAGFCARECFHPWIHMLPSCFSPVLLSRANRSCKLCGWHGYMFQMNMTMWLTSWCEC